ncbi:hypothetical protein BJY16_007546 [Actinoplanes octamycinicus]|uniref:eCIS core domain-containing protein n=1 Tax=Actinoplanes octamycinicus TaxID=135948 RepID=A0A7W7H577_9ACTN|nr:DUF4157 domain-containing protein [Actinoplanes octamycinicus]MBB4744087.1 hypothetical protein [Actinoplanes octamycinicus]GIE56956.1 hypothetical protein Aoc01nite_23580 [Actinoplanes octamycinicus]
MTGRIRRPATTPAGALPVPSRVRPAVHPLLRLQRQIGNQSVQRLLDPDELDRARGTGAALDDAVRAPMEAAFGADFGAVRVHTGGAADRLSRALGAHAFTTGRDIFFRAGGYEPDTTAGRRLLAHELTHVVQQSAAVAAGELSVSDPDDEFEREADQVADRIVSRADDQ